MSFDIGQFFSQGNSGTASTGSGTAGGAGYSNASRSAAATQLTPTIIVGGIGSGLQSASTTPTLAASPDGSAQLGGLLPGNNSTLMSLVIVALVVALVVRK